MIKRTHIYHKKFYGDKKNNSLTVLAIFGEMELMYIQKKILIYYKKIITYLIILKIFDYLFFLKYLNYIFLKIIIYFIIIIINILCNL